MDDVELADISATRAGLLVAGPQAASTPAASIDLSREQPRSTRNCAHIMARRRSRPSSTPTARSSPASSSGPIPPTIAASHERSSIAGATPVDARSPRSPPHPRRHAPLRHRHPQLRDRQDLPQETAPDPRPALHQRLLPRPGDRRAHPLPRQRPPHLHRLRPRRRLPAAGTPLEAEGKASRRTHQRRRHPAPQPATQFSSPSATSAAKPSTAISPYTPAAPQRHAAIPYPRPAADLESSASERI